MHSPSDTILTHLGCASSSASSLRGRLGWSLQDSDWALRLALGWITRRDVHLVVQLKLVSLLELLDTLSQGVDVSLSALLVDLVLVVL